MAFFHPEDVVKAELPPTAADNKGIGVGEKENRENTKTIILRHLKQYY